MPTHIALLRGINLGGNNRVAMAELREVVGSLGHADVATYIQSGNVLFSPAQEGPAQEGPAQDGPAQDGPARDSTGRADTAALATELQRAIADRLGVQAGVVVLSRGELAKVAADNPYPDEPNPKSVHVIFLPGEPEPGHADRLAEAQRQAAEKGSRDEVTLVRRAVFLHTPDGYGNSELAKLLGRSGGPMSAKSAGTARNWSTVTKLLALCDA